jgi:transposase
MIISLSLILFSTRKRNVPCSRVVRFYQLQHRHGSVHATRDKERHAQSSELFGDYVLETERTLSDSQTWQLYMVLLLAEEGFACLKDSLGLRPNYHQLEQRVEAHIFISALPYHLQTWIRESLRRYADHRDWKTVRRLLSTHSILTTVLPLKDGRFMRIRKTSRTDPEQGNSLSAASAQ